LLAEAEVQQANGRVDIVLGCQSVVK